MARILRFSAFGAPLVLCLLAACVPVKPIEQLHPDPDNNLVRVDDTNVYVEQAGRGEPVILIHGFGSSTYSWRMVMPELAKSYRVIALDLYGFGWTERPEDWNRYTRDGQVELILDVMDALGVDSAHMVGHSYGGSITMALAADHPERLRSMVLVNSAAVDYPMHRRKWFSRVGLLNFAYVRGLALRTGFVERVMGKAYYDDALVTDDLIEAYLDRLRVEGAAQGFRGLSKPLPASQRPRDIQYEDLDVPALLLWGAQDELITIEVGRHHAALFPDIRFVAIEGAGHAPMEERPIEFVDELTAFLEEIDRREESLRVAHSRGR